MRPFCFVTLSQTIQEFPLHFLIFCRLVQINGTKLKSMYKKRRTFGKKGSRRGDSLPGRLQVWESPFALRLGSRAGGKDFFHSGHLAPHFSTTHLIGPPRSSGIHLLHIAKSVTIGKSPSPSVPLCPRPSYCILPQAQHLPWIEPRYDDEIFGASLFPLLGGTSTSRERKPKSKQINLKST